MHHPTSHLSPLSYHLINGYLSFSTGCNYLVVLPVNTPINCNDQMVHLHMNLKINDMTHVVYIEAGRHTLPIYSLTIVYHTLQKIHLAYIKQPLTKVSNAILSWTFKYQFKCITIILRLKRDNIIITSTF